MVTVEIGRDGTLGARPAQPCSAATGAGAAEARAETLPVPGTSARSRPRSASVDVVLPILHGPFGEDGRSRGCSRWRASPYVGAGYAASALCMDKDLFKAVMRDQGIPVTRNITLRDGDPAREPVRLPRLREAGAARLLGRDHEGARRRRARRGRRARLPARREGARRGVRRRDRGRGRRARQPASRSRRSPARSSSRATSGTTTRRSTTRARWTWSSRPDHAPSRPRACRSSRSRRSSRPSARGWPASTASSASDGEVLVNELNTIPGLHRDERLREALRGLGHPVPELLERLIELALERHERRAQLAVLASEIARGAGRPPRAPCPGYPESCATARGRPVGDHERSHRGGGCHGRRPRHIRDERDLAEEIPRPERWQQPGVAADVGRPFQEHEELAPARHLPWSAPSPPADRLRRRAGRSARARPSKARKERHVSASLSIFESLSSPLRRRV